MATLGLTEYKDASPEVRAVYDDIMATRKTDWVNNYWKVLAHHAPTLRRMWANAKEVMGPGALDPLAKELIYIAVSVTNGCDYCIASHGAAARAKGMTAEQYSELVAIIGPARQTRAWDPDSRLDLSVFARAEPGRRSRAAALARARRAPPRSGRLPRPARPAGGGRRRAAGRLRGTRYGARRIGHPGRPAGHG